MESWSKVRIFHSGDEYFESMLQDIRGAQRSITIESYIFEDDALTRKILNELSEARKRGCSVKIVVDGFGSYFAIPRLDQYCETHGLEFRVFHPLPYPIIWARHFFMRYTQNGPTPFRRMNRRTHRKITIIDETCAYLGSLNFTQDHCAQYKGAEAMRDTGVRLEGPGIKRLVLAFQISYLRTYMRGILEWVGRWKFNEPPSKNSLRLNTTKKMRKLLYKDLLRRLSQAQNRIYITTAYFLPRRSLMRALIKASQRGTDVQLLIPGKSDVPMVKWAAFNIVRLLVKKRIPIFEYQKSILHAKTMIIDDEVFIGSFNLNHRSVMHDLEVEVVLRDQESLQNMLIQWQKDLDDSRVASDKDFAPPSWIARLIYRLAFRLRYLL